MKITYKHLFTVSALLTCVFLSTSCKDDDVDSEKDFKKEMAKVEEAYAKTFESIFGKIDPNQSWDFSNFGTRGTRAGSVTNYPYYSISSGYYEVGKAASQWLDQNLIEGEDNRDQGDPLSFVMPHDGIIDLIPYYQGWSVSAWDMHMKVKPLNNSAEEIDINFWTKNQNIEVKKRKITWDSKGFRIKNKKDGKYLSILPRNCHKFIIAQTNNNNSWVDQIYMELDNNGKLEKNKQYRLCFSYFVSKDTHISMDFHTAVSSNETGNNADANISSVSIGEIGGNLSQVTCSPNEIPLSANNEWKYIQIDFTVPENLAGGDYKYIALSLCTKPNDKNSDTEFLLKDYYLCIQGDWNHLLKDDKILSHFDGNNFIQSYPTWITTEISMVQKNNMNNIDDNSDKPYKNSNEAGLRFTVVTIQNGNTAAKYLYAFVDDPAQGGFVSVSNGSVVFVPIGEAVLSIITPIRSHDEPYFDKYLMLGEYLIYESEGNLAAISINDTNFRSGYDRHLENNPWNMTDVGRRKLLDDNNGYNWTYERYDAYEAEKKAIGCNSDGTSLTGFSTNVYNKFGGSNDFVWMPVESDYYENTVGKDIRAKHYEFNFSKLIEENPAYKNAIISFYWETLTPWYRRNDSTGKYLYSDLAGNEQMYAITKATAPTVQGFDNVVVIGCEAGNLRGRIIDKFGNEKPDTDYDYNDVVFLMATNNPPTYTDREGKDIVVQKRYMVEDLGNSDDIDFNDMVVDVRQITPVTETINDTNGKVESVTYGETRQEVIVRAVGGTLPFDFYIGDTKIFSKSDLKYGNSSIDETKMYNTGCGNGSSSASGTYGIGSHSSDIDYEAILGTFDITTKYGNIWSPSENNIKFEVIHGSFNEEGVTDAYKVTTITFPRLGEVPHILAFEVPFYWRNERRLCCWDWILKHEPALWVMPESKDDKEHGYTDPQGTSSSTHLKNFSTWLGETTSEAYLKWIQDNFGSKAKAGMQNWLEKFYR